MQGLNCLSVGRDRILIKEVHDPKKTPEGIYVPTSSELCNTVEAEVVASYGDRGQYPRGTRIFINLKAAQESGNAQLIHFEGETGVIIRQDEVLAYYNPTKSKET